MKPRNIPFTSLSTSLVIGWTDNSISAAVSLTMLVTDTNCYGNTSTLKDHNISQWKDV